MAGREREITVTILGKDRGARKALDELGDRARKTEGIFDGLGHKLASFGKTAALGLAAAGAGAGLFLKDAIGGASDLAETISKSNTIFGQSAKEIENWAGTAAKSFGQSKQGALDAAATFGNLFVQLGTGSGEAAKMSKQMVELASDFASFHNAAPTDVIEAMTAAFRGEYDAVQRYVPTINAAAVEQKALAMNLAGSTKELTAQDKALATQALLMEGAGDAMGDFARTSDGLANRQRILSAQFQDMKDRIGTALLPVVLRVMEAFMGLGAVIGPIASKIGEFIRNAFAPGRQDVTWLDTLVGGLRALIGAFRNAEEGITSSGFAGKMEEIGIAARAVVDWVIANWPKIQETIAEVLTTVQAVIAGFAEIVMVIWNNFGEQIVSSLKAVWSTVMEVIDGALDIIRGIVATVTAIIRGDWSAAWEGIQQIVAGAGQAIVAIIEGATTVMNNIISVAMEILVSVIRGAFNGVVGFVASIPGRILGALGDLGGLLFGAGQDLIWGLIRGITGMARRLIDAALAPVRAAVNAVKGFLGIGSPSKLFEGFGVNVGEGFVRGLDKSEGPVAAAGTGLAAASASMPSDLARHALGNAPHASATGGTYNFYLTAGTLVGEDGMRQFIDMIQSQLLQKQRRVVDLGLT